MRIRNIIHKSIFIYIYQYENIITKEKEKRKRKKKKILSSSSNKNYFILIIIIIFSLSIFVYMYMLSSMKSDDTYNNIKPGQVKNVNSLRKRGRRNSASNFPFIAGRKIHNKDCDSTQEQIFYDKASYGRGDAYCDLCWQGKSSKVYIPCIR